MKRILTLTVVVMATLTSWLGVGASAQNAIFEKYADMEDLEYVCVTSAMLKNLGKSATINGIHIEGITSALKNILIIHSSTKKCADQMKEDFAKLRKNDSYEMMMDMRDGTDRVITLVSLEKNNCELVMFIQESNREASFVVLNGKFTEKQLRQLLSSLGNN